MMVVGFIEIKTIIIIIIIINNIILLYLLVLVILYIFNVPYNTQKQVAWLMNDRYIVCYLNQ